MRGEGGDAEGDVGSGGQGEKGGRHRGVALPKSIGQPFI